MSEPERHSTLSRGLVAVGAVAFAVLHTSLARWKALGLMSEWPFDVTFFHGLIWNSAQGNGYRQSSTYHELPGLFAETHFEPIILVVVPFYKLAPGLTTMFAVQSALLALGAFGVYRLVRAEGGVPLAGAAAAWLYLGWWPLWRMALADFRPLLFALPLLILCAAALREAKHTEAFAWALAACMSREEVPLLVLGLCFAAALWRDEDSRLRRRTAALLAVATVFFVVCTTMLRSNASFYIRPDEWLKTLLSAGGGESIDAGWGHSAGELLGNRLRFLGGWLWPVGLGVELAPELLLAAAPLFLYLFTQPHEWAGWEGPYIHHTAPAAGLVVAAAAVGWTRLFRRTRARKPVVIAALIVLGLAEVVTFTGIKQGSRELVYGRWDRYVAEEIAPWRQQHDRVIEAHRLADQVPDDASVAAGWHTVHLFSGRERVYSYHQEAPDEITPGPDEPMLLRPQVTPEWALVHVDDAGWHARALAHDMVERDRGMEWVLYGPR